MNEIINAFLSLNYCSIQFCAEDYLIQFFIFIKIIQAEKQKTLYQNKLNQSIPSRTCLIFLDLKIKSISYFFPLIYKCQKIYHKLYCMTQNKSNLFDTIIKKIDKRTNMVFTLYGNVLNIKCYINDHFHSQNFIEQNEETFNISYLHAQFPDKLRLYYPNVRQLFKAIAAKSSKMQIEDINTLMFITKQTQFEIPLGDRIQYQKKHEIVEQLDPNKKPVQDMSVHPFNAIGKFQMKFVIEGEDQKSFLGTGTGALIKTTLVLTAAHIVYHRESQSEIQPQNIFFYLPNGRTNGQRRKKVKGIWFPQQYKNLGEKDSHVYDFALVWLHPNQNISQELPLQMQWDSQIGLKEEFLVSGYPKYDKSKQYFDVKSIIGKYQRYLEYIHNLVQGHSGSPILKGKVQNGKKKYKIIGVHRANNKCNNVKNGIFLSSKTINCQEYMINWFKEIETKQNIPKTQTNKKISLTLESENEEKSQVLLKELMIIKQKQDEKLKKIQQKLKPLLNKFQSLNGKSEESLKTRKKSTSKKQIQETKEIQNKNQNLIKLNELLRNVTMNLQKVIQDLETINQIQSLDKVQTKKEVKKQTKSLNKVPSNQFRTKKLISPKQSLTKIKKLDLLTNIKPLDPPAAKLTFNNVKEKKKKNGNVVYILQFSKDQQYTREFQKNETNFDLSKTEITDDEVSTICNLLPKLKQLKLNECQHIKSIKLKDCKKLQKLFIKQSSSLTNIQLEQMPALNTLNLDKCRELLSIKLTSCSQIAQLYLDQSKIDDDNLQLLIKQVPNLQVMRLFNCMNLKKTIKLKNCKKLTELGLRNINQPHQNLVQLLDQQLPQLTTMSLTGWKQIQFCQLKFINYNKLIDLSLAQTLVRDEDLQEIGKQLPQLNSLVLIKCKNLVKPPLSNFNNLKKLLLQHSSVTKEKVQELQEQHPDLSIYYKQ